MNVAISNKNNENVGILYGYGNGTFAPVVLYSTGDGSSPYCVRSGDLNNDKVIDIVVASPGNDCIMVIYGSGDGRFLLGTSFSTGTKSRPISLAVGDFNRDKILDIVIVTAGTSSLILAQGYGNETSYAMGYNFNIYAVALADFNGDGLIDITIANYGGDFVDVLLQTC